jgi:hypothetical protein
VVHNSGSWGRGKLRGVLSGVVDQSLKSLDGHKIGERLYIPTKPFPPWINKKNQIDHGSVGRSIVL